MENSTQIATEQVRLNLLLKKVDQLEKKLAARNIEPRMVSPEEVTILYPICLNKVWEVISAGQIDTYKVGKRVMMKVKDWDDLIESKKMDIPEV